MSTNQRTVVAIAVVIVILVGLWYLYPSAPVVSDTSVNPAASTTPVTSTNTPASKPSTATTPKTKSAFRSIFTQSGNHQCTYEQVAANGNTSSVVYIADGMMRGEFRTTSGTNTQANFMIYKGGSLYSWKEGATTGTRTNISAISDIPQVIPNDLTSGASFGVSNDSVSWDCHDWAKDASLFVIPTYVKFSV